MKFKVLSTNTTKLEHKLILDRGICTYEIKLETAPHYHSDRFAVPMS